MHEMNFPVCGVTGHGSSSDEFSRNLITAFLNIKFCFDSEECEPYKNPASAGVFVITSKI